MLYLLLESVLNMIEISDMKLKDKLQIAQNKCILFCLILGNREGIRYKDLNKIKWLAISERVKQFIAVSVYKFLNNLTPSYMEDIFTKAQNKVH